jgi:hypothetical protein
VSSRWDEPATLAQVDALTAAGLSPGAVEHAVDLLATPPSAAAWAGFLDRVLLALGSALLVSAVVYGVAWNWSEIGELSRLVGVELVFAATGGVAVWRGTATASGRAAALAAAALIGPLLGLVGITWQTGADPWTLFAAWSGLSLALVAAAGSGWGWAGWLLVVDLAVALWIGQAGGWPMATAPLVVIAALAGLHLAGAALLLGAGGAGWLRAVEAPALALVGLALVVLTGPALAVALDWHDGGVWLVVDLAMWAGLVVAHGALLVARRSVSAGAAAGLSVLAVVTTAFMRVALKIDDGPIMWFVCGVFVLTGAIGLAAGIRAVARRGGA